jgi:phosphate uptake regulator
MAIDLRETISAIRVSGDLERIGDLAREAGIGHQLLGDAAHLGDAAPQVLQLLIVGGDDVQREIEEKAILLIAKRQPMAIDLRETISAIRVSRRRCRPSRRCCAAGSAAPDRRR